MQHRFRTVGEITITNTLSAREDSTASAVATKLLLTSFPVMPVLDHSGKVTGKVTEMDLLKAFKMGVRMARQPRYFSITREPTKSIGPER